MERTTRITKLGANGPEIREKKKTSPSTALGGRMQMSSSKLEYFFFFPKIRNKFTDTATLDFKWNSMASNTPMTSPGDRWGVDERTCSTNKKKETKNDWPCLWNFFFLQKSKRHFELGKVFTENGVAHQPTQVTHLLITCRYNRPWFFFFFFFLKKEGKM